MQTATTVCMHFYWQNDFFQNLIKVISYWTNPLSKLSKKQNSFGLIFDSTLTFKNYIQYLKPSCLKALDILHVDTQIGELITQFSASTVLEFILNWTKVPLFTSRLQRQIGSYSIIHHQGLRIALGAVRTSPVQSLYMYGGSQTVFVFLSFETFTELCYQIEILCY